MQRIVRLTLPMLALLLASATPYAAGTKVVRLSLARQKPLPSFVQLSLLGEKLSMKNHVFIYYDPKTRYYFESDGWVEASALQPPIITSLTLTPNRKQLGFTESYIGQKVRDISLPALNGGTGIHIGDTKNMVRRKLRASPLYQEYHPKTKTSIWVYKAKIPVTLLANPTLLKAKHIEQTQNWVYRAKYTFHKERVWSINYFAVVPSRAAEAMRD